MSERSPFLVRSFSNEPLRFDATIDDFRICLVRSRGKSTAPPVVTSRPGRSAQTHTADPATVITTINHDGRAKVPSRHNRRLNFTHTTKAAREFYLQICRKRRTRFCRNASRRRVNRRSRRLNAAIRPISAMLQKADYSLPTPTQKLAYLRSV